MVCFQAHHSMDTLHKKAGMEVDTKISALNNNQERMCLNDLAFYDVFLGQIQGLKTARVTVAHDDCMVEDILAALGLTVEMALKTEWEAELCKSDEQVSVMLYL